MNNDDAYSRNFSIGSDRELDNLSMIRNLDTSHSDVEFRKTMDSSSYDKHKEGRTSREGRGPRTGHWASEFGTVAETLESHDKEGTDDTPVRKLKQKNVTVGPVEREYSDAYLESNLRTPRYNTHTSYEGMLENLDPEDPFDGDYTPSGKPKYEKRKKSKKDKSPEGHTKIPVPAKDDSQRTQKHRRSKRKKKGHGSLESTSTFTIEGNTNQSFKLAETDKASVKSNGTFTVPEKGYGKSPRSTSRVSAVFNRSRKSRYSKRTKIGIDRSIFKNFVHQENIMQRRSKHLKESTPGNKHIPHFYTDSTAELCDSFGEIMFVGYGHDTDKSPYIRVSPDTSPKKMYDLMLNIWELSHPQLLISVTGGAKRFDLKPRLANRFKRGLMKAAISTGAWIVTGGTGTGVMEFVGEAVRDHFITFGKRDNIVALGVPTWGAVAGNESLDGDDDLKDGLFPAVYNKHLVESATGKKVPLDHNHTHFILVDDGTDCKFGGEIEFRSKLEGHISQQECDPESETCVHVPVVMIIVEGGINSMKTVWQSIKNEVPVLVLDGSGRAADFIAEGYRQTQVASLKNRQTEKSAFSANFEVTMEVVAEELFEWRPQDLSKKSTIISGAIKQLKECLEKRNMIHIYDLENAKEEMDEAILLTLFKANKSSTDAQLSLALTWNRSDIAKNQIFKLASRDKWQEMNLDDGMVKSLIQNRTEFVKLFLENATDMEQFLDINNLWNIYANCMVDKSDRAAQLLKNHMMYIKQSWGAYFCCRPLSTFLEQPPDLLVQIGKVIVHLLGDEALNPYKGSGSSTYIVENVQPKLRYIKTQETEKRKHMAFSKRRSKMKVYFDNPNKELFLWAVMMNRKDIAMLFWKRGRDYTCSALMASALTKALAKIADSDEDMELSLSYMENSKFYEGLACSLITECYIQNRYLATSMLVQTVEQYGNTTQFTIADANEMMDFMGQTACMAKLNSIWKGRMALYTSNMKIIISIFIPFLIPAIKFITSKAPGEDLEREEEEIIEEECMAMSEDPHATTNKVTPENTIDFTEKELKPKKHGKFYKVAMCACGNTEDTISIPYAIYYFYTAPVTKFWIYLISYLVFIGIFTLFVLTDLHAIDDGGISVYEYITWGWTVTMVTEEVRQILMKEQLSLLYKLRSWWGSVWNKFDLIMYILFLSSFIMRFSLSKEDFLWARMTYSITLAMYIMRTMQFFFVEKNIGPKVIMIRKMITDIQFFFMILAVFVFSFGVTYQANLFPNAPQSWSLLKDIVYLPYWQMYGELFIENIEGSEPSSCTDDPALYLNGTMTRCPQQNAIVPLLLAIYMVLTNILLVNLLIAMFSDTFQKVQDKSEQVWKFYKFSLVYEYYDRPALVPPFIILNHIFRIARNMIVICCGKFPYYDDFRLEMKEEEDIVRLRLFEKEAMETYMYETKQAMSNDLNFQVSSTSERLERVIDELDKIKESVSRHGMEGSDSKPPLTARTSFRLSQMSTTTTASVQGPNVQDQIEKLTFYVHSEVQDMTKAMSRMEKLLLDLKKNQLQTPSLDITNLHPDT
ncbi:TRPM3 [Mytilus coruscus]|uniref:TRPM3 n=1 Tax=Mytilus coruscus TaxID=42192 RepID=A0A6J8AH52_MYTCO|nr:TRPM3 [Mytilus coruscus]